MCCNTGSHQGMQAWGDPHGCACGCLGSEFPRPRVMTKAQRMAYLKQHLSVLRDEVTAVEEVLAALEKEA